MKKIGLFFGTFNPIHNGHLELAEFFLSNSDISEIYFIVTPVNPFKVNSKIVDNRFRLEMVKIATASEKNFYPSNIEFNIPPPNYTIKTVLKIVDESPNTKFSILMGEDNLSSFNKWKEYKLILEEECNNLNIEFLDCNSYFDKKFDEKWLFNDRIHLTDLGNEKVVDLIKSKF